jgi:release factor glutamine methyltransferase
MIEQAEASPASIERLLRASGLDPREARVLLRAALGVDEAYLAAHPERVASAAERERFLAWVARRRAGEPVAYLTGKREFFGLAFKVTPAVLIPRPETELLVEAALARLAPQAAARVLDLGTGSGCVAIAIACSRPRARVTASDSSRAALALARENAARHRVRVAFVASDWFEALGGERYDLIVSNPPYVAQGDPHLEQGDLRFEPRAALVAGRDGLECIREIVQGARAHLAPGGWLLFEHGHDQGARARALLGAAGYAQPFTLRDLARLERVSGGRLLAAA